MYKQDLALNNLHGLICCKTHPTNIFFTMLHILIAQFFFKQDIARLWENLFLKSNVLH